MGLFDRFRKKKPSVPLPQLCYDVAYFILPQYVHNDPAKLADLWYKTPTAAGPFFYVMACQMRQVEPTIEDAKLFRWHQGDLDDGRYYQRPGVSDSVSGRPLGAVSGRPGEGRRFSRARAALFSGIIGEVAASELGYYILGQSPMGGGTTLRSVLREGVNCNLGPGPEPRLASFIEAISARPYAR